MLSAFISFNCLEKNMRCHFAIGAFFIVCTCAQLTIAAEENWPQWRGPLGTGVAADGEYPVKFSTEEGVAWKVKLPGTGSSTPAVWGERIFVTCDIDGQDGLVCYDMKARSCGKRQFGPEPRRQDIAIGSGSNPSPVTDGKHVVVYYKSGTLACLDVGGQRDLEAQSCRSNTARTRCGGTWARRRCWSAAGSLWP